MDCETCLLATTSHNVASMVLGISLIWVFYTYLGYPFILSCLARCFGRLPIVPQVCEDQYPSVSVLIAAWNEEDVIEERILNLLELDYPPDKLEIVIASDGSQDDTVDIVQSYALRGVRLLNYQLRRGKASVLNASINEMRGEILVLTDANTEFAPDAVKKLARWFHDPEIGAVCGQLVVVDPQSGRNADGIYWVYETFLKQCENQLSALLGANGAIYAIRKCRYVPLPKNTILDDLVIPLIARLKNGCRTVYDIEAIAWEESPRGMRSEFYRRMRIGSGGFQSIGILWNLLNPAHGWITLAYWSHKVSRWLCPLFLICAFVSNAMLIHQTFFLTLFVAQIAFYGVAFVGSLVSGNRLGAKLLRIPTMFAGLNLAIFLGSLRWGLGLCGGTWSRTERTPRTQPMPAMFSIKEGTFSPHIHMFGDDTISPPVGMIESTSGKQS